MNNKIESRIGRTGRPYDRNTTCIPEVSGLVQDFCRLKVALQELGARGKEDMSGPGALSRLKVGLITPRWREEGNEFSYSCSVR